MDVIYETMIKQQLESCLNSHKGMKSNCHQCDTSSNNQSTKLNTVIFSKTYRLYYGRQRLLANKKFSAKSINPFKK